MPTIPRPGANQVTTVSALAYVQGFSHDDETNHLWWKINKIGKPMRPKRPPTRDR